MQHNCVAVLADTHKEEEKGMEEKKVGEKMERVSRNSAESCKLKQSHLPISFLKMLICAHFVQLPLCMSLLCIIAGWCADYAEFQPQCSSKVSKNLFLCNHMCDLMSCGITNIIRCEEAC